MRAAQTALALLCLLAAPAHAADLAQHLHLAPRRAGEAAVDTWRSAIPSALSPWQRAQAALSTPTGELRPLHSASAREACLDLVIVGDGFTAAEKSAFFAAADADSKALLAFGPYAAYHDLFNTYALFVASNQTGADHPSLSHFVDTAFDTTYEYGGFERLAVANNDKVLQAVGTALPDFDLAVVLVNDTAYGGSGGPVPVASLDPEAIAILHHEIGHNIAMLADEYTAPYPGYPTGDPEPNVAAAAHLHPLKWQDWQTAGAPIPTPIAAATSALAPIGAYEGARYLDKGMFRPAPQCLMRSLDQVFCPVCAEAMALAISARTQSLRARGPAAACVACEVGACPTFSVGIADIATLQVRWRWNETLVGEGLSWQPDAGRQGEATLTAEIVDSTTAVRSDPDGALVESVSWQLRIGAPALADCPALSAADVAFDAAEVSPPQPAATPQRTAADCQASPRTSTDAKAAVALVLALGLLGTLTRRKRT